MSSATATDAPIDLPVTNLKAAQVFYSAALGPLGYRILSHGRNQSSAISFAPKGTNRVDLVLHKSTQRASETVGGKTYTLNFPADSRAAVNNFFDAVGGRQGGVSLEPPSDGPNDFTAAVKDLDGNHVQVTFQRNQIQLRDGQSSDASMNSSKVKPIEAWRNDVGQQIVPDLVQGPRAQTWPRYDPSTYAPPYAPVRQMPSETRRLPPRSTTRAKSFGSTSSSKSFNGPGFESKLALGAVAAVVGVAAGVAHLFKKQVEDTEEKEEKMRKEQKRRRQLEKGVKKVDGAVAAEPSRRNSVADRDSGYWTREETHIYKVQSRSRSQTLPPAPRKRGGPPSAASRNPMDAGMPPPSRRAPTSRNLRRESDAGDRRSHIAVSEAPSKPAPPTRQLGSTSSKGPRTRRADSQSSYPPRERGASQTQASRQPDAQRSSGTASNRERSGSSRSARPSGPRAPREGSNTTVRRSTRRPPLSRVTSRDESGPLDDLDSILPEDSASNVSVRRMMR